MTISEFLDVIHWSDTKFVIIIDDEQIEFMINEVYGLDDSIGNLEITEVGIDADKKEVLIYVF